MRCPVCGTNNENEAVECAACGHTFVEQKEKKKKDTDISWVRDIDFTAGIDWNDDIAKPDIKQILTEKSDTNCDTKDKKVVIPSNENYSSEDRKEENPEVLQRVILEAARKDQLNKQRREQELKRQKEQELREEEMRAFQEEEKRKQEERERLKKLRQEKLRQERLEKEKIQKELAQKEQISSTSSPANPPIETEDDGEREYENRYANFTKWLLIVVAVCVIAAIIAVIVLATRGIKKDQVTYYQPTYINTEAASEIEKQEDTIVESSESMSTAQETESESETKQETTLAEEEVVKMDSYELLIKNGEATITKYNGKESTIRIPASYNQIPIRYIDVDAFKGCTFITQIEIPEGIVSIGENAFYGCSSLTLVAMPDSLQNIGEGAFNYCSAFTIICNKNTFAQSFSDKYHVPTIEGNKLP